MKPADARRAGHRKRRGFLLWAAGAITVLVTAGLLSGCARTQNPVPRCGDAQRLAIIAQSVPTASYVPCVRQLPQGWEASAFDPHQGGTRFRLESDRAPGRPVTVALRPECTVAAAAPEPPRADGVLTYMRLRSVYPSYTGTLFDVFPGGCVSYGFSFVRGSHIALMEQFQTAIGLYPRQQLQIDLRKKLGVELDP